MLYEYECGDCGAIQEKLHWHGVPPPCCGKDMLRKLGTFAQIRMAGLGYNSRRKYVTGTAPYTTRATKEWTPENKVSFK